MMALTSQENTVQTKKHQLELRIVVRVNGLAIKKLQTKSPSGLSLEGKRLGKQKNSSHRG